MQKEVNSWKKIYEDNQKIFKDYTAKYESIMKEKMIMKLEKERLVAKVENMEKSLIQIEEEAEVMKDWTDMKSKLLDT